jgi:hypothetical protein
VDGDDHSKTSTFSQAANQFLLDASLEFIAKESR